MMATLGGMRPGSAYHVLPGHDQQWWKPCLRRGPESTDTHVWYLSPTSDGSLLCPQCRVGTARVIVGPKEWIAQIREASDQGDMRAVRVLIGQRPSALLDEVQERFGHLSTEGIYTPPPFQARDRADWQEFYAERAAIFEYLGGMSRDISEQAAFALAGGMPL